MKYHNGTRAVISRCHKATYHISLARYITITGGSIKPIVIINGVDELADELRRVGNNLNQITRAVNAGMISAAELNETREELKKIWQSLNSLPRAVR